MTKLLSHGQSVITFDEYMVADESDAANIPNDAPVGSRAYTADMSYYAIKDEDGVWQPVLGGS